MDDNQRFDIEKTVTNNTNSNDNDKTERRVDSVDGHILPVISVYTAWENVLYSDKPVLTAEDAINLIGQDMINLACESSAVICQNAEAKPICVGLLTKGSMTYTIFPFHRLMQIAMLSGASGITLVHNHPGFCDRPPKPSPGDITTTSLMIRVCDLFNMPLHDSVVVGCHRMPDGELVPEYHSLRSKHASRLRFKPGVKPGFTDFLAALSNLSFNNLDWDKKTSEKYWKTSLEDDPDVKTIMAYNQKEFHAAIESVNKMREEAEKGEER